MMAFWKRDLDFVCDLTKKNPDAIIIGDFNATMRHGSLNNVATHSDVLSCLSSFANGTWPVKLPACFRAPIDHVLLPKNQYNVENIEVRTLTSSDHAAVFVELYAKNDSKQ